MNKLLDTLSICPLFEGKNESELQSILSQIQYQIKRFNKNDFIFQADETSINMGIIIKGYVEVKKILSSGNVISIFHRSKGKLFGGAVAFSNKSSYPCDVLAREKSEILFIDKQSVFETLCKDPLIVSNLMNLFANEVFQFEKRLELYSYSSIKKKIAFSLLYDMVPSDGEVINLPYSKKTWAEHLNVSRPSLCRELKKLSSQDILSIKDRTIVLIKKDQLESILIE